MTEKPEIQPIFDQNRNRWSAFSTFVILSDVTYSIDRIDNHVHNTFEGDHFLENQQQVFFIEEEGVYSFGYYLI